MYKPAEEFVSKMSLCPHYIGVGKSKHLLPAILRMVNLVKQKEATASNKKSWRQWLKEAARALEAYQVADRGWISKNVQTLSKRQVQESPFYNPMAGRRDIRFYPPATMVEPTQQEDVLEVELTKEEEDALLMSPPKKASQAPSPVPSSRRSPRIASKRQEATAKAQLSETSSHDTGASRPVTMDPAPRSPQQSDAPRPEASSPSRESGKRYRSRQDGS